jgi:arylsulfatase A
VIAAGRVSDVPTSTVDFFPTLLELTGKSAASSAVIDGVSLAGHLRGGGAPTCPAIFWHYPHYHSSGEGGPAGAVRAGEWKLVEYYEHTLAKTGRPPELYHLRTDPGETKNLAASDPARVASLLSLLAAHRAATDAQMPTLNPAYDPAKAR